jgi:hypothetical protein
LDDELFGVGDWFVVREDGSDERFVGGDVFVRKKHFGTEQAVLESVHGTLLFRL